MLNWGIYRERLLHAHTDPLPRGSLPTAAIQVSGTAPGRLAHLGAHISPRSLRHHIALPPPKPPPSSYTRVLNSDTVAPSEPSPCSATQPAATTAQRGGAAAGRGPAPCTPGKPPRLVSPQRGALPRGAWRGLLLCPLGYELAPQQGPQLFPQDPSPLPLPHHEQRSSPHPSALLPSYGKAPADLPRLRAREVATKSPSAVCRQKTGM